MNLVSLQLKTTTNFEKNLKKLIKSIQKLEKNSFILAPELCLNGYSYNKMDKAATISKKAIKKLSKLSKFYTIALTLTIKKDNNYYNIFHIFHKGKIIHTQGKNKLFVLNDEKKHFSAGDEKDIKIFQIGDLKVATLICF